MGLPLASPIERKRTPSTGRTRGQRQEEHAFWVFMAPWIIGFIFFTGGPIIASALLSLTNYSVTRPPMFVGLQNYATLFTDSTFQQSVTVTLYYTALAVPLTLVAALLCALLLTQKLRGLAIFRTIFYLPTVISGVAVALLWEWLLNPEFGLMNYILRSLGLHGPLWFTGQSSVIPAFVLMAVWALGGQMIVFLAALTSVPRVYYEACQIDGASTSTQFFRVTLPLISPAILFNFVTGIIASFQTFVPAQVITQGGPNFASEFYVLYLFDNAFEYFKLGYASAQAWILFIVILGLTLAILLGSRRLIYYEAD